MALKPLPCRIADYSLLKQFHNGDVLRRSLVADDQVIANFSSTLASISYRVPAISG
jgi:hypothetical protein